MVFDKTKSMRNAERYVAQGKIQSAIGEYKQVVANDPKDFGTLNMLGDLYAKNSETKQAIRCYTSVAEHYSKQGFAQKAIAVYNKISKIQPGSIEISAKLADLYKFKGSMNEARSHYKIVAEHYESHGQKLQALEVRKQIASLDPRDADIQLKLAAAFLDEDQVDDAADAFLEAGVRLAKRSDHDQAIEALEKALGLRTADPKILTPLVQSHFARGTAREAAARLAEMNAVDPHNRDVLHLLIDCYLETGDTAQAEKALISLVEKEPANYPKLVDLARTYLKDAHAESAARIMAVASEHLLLAGQAAEFQSLLDEILALDPEQLEAVRLEARFAAWQRDEVRMHDSLVRLATVAKQCESIDDERFALSQLAMIAPHEVEHGERLKAINDEYGFTAADSNESLFDAQFMKGPKQEEPALETFSPIESETVESIDAFEEALGADFAIVDSSVELIEPADDEDATPESDDERLLREIDSIKFYIDSGYLELAGKAIGELRSEFGDCPEIDDLQAHLNQQQTLEVDEIDEPVAAKAEMEPVAVETPVPTTVETNGKVETPKGFGIDDLRNELGIDEADAVDDSDYDTHYHTAVAYQEMGLLDEAIREFQEAAGLVRPGDGTRRFFQCSNLLGHCFMQKGMANLALKWYQRTLETPGLSDEEKQGIWYELAAAYEADGDMDNAARYFEQVYAENIDFRDVSERVKNIAVSHQT